MMDATVYESNIRYPTDAKLIWESIVKVHQILQQKRGLLKLRPNRSNYQKHKSNYLGYQRNRRKSKRKDKKLHKQLLKYLHRLLKGLQDLQTRHKLRLSNTEIKLINNVNTIYDQQHELLYGNRENVKHRIVSLSKPYVRPIIRGKEVKPVEFGAKVHKVQVGGLSFIEHLSYENFNEGTRLKQSIAFHQKHFGKCSQLAADAIYATRKQEILQQSGDCNQFYTQGQTGKTSRTKIFYALCIEHCKSHCA
jgi:hypothetical protein